MSNLSEEEIQEAAKKYWPLAIALAKRRRRKLPPETEELGDIIGTASVGLVECLRRYDPSHGTPLTQWVSYSIENAITDYLRQLDWLPQKERAQVKRLQEAEPQLEKSLGRKPTIKELAQRLGISMQEIEKCLRYRNVVSVFWEDVEIASEPQSWEYGSAEVDIKISQYWERLSEIEKVAMSLHLEGSRLEDIAVVLATSRATAGRILQCALRELCDCLSSKGK